MIAPPIAKNTPAVPAILNIPDRGDIASDTAPTVATL